MLSSEKGRGSTRLVPSRRWNRCMKSKRTAFLFDRMLGRLCRKMRLLGYDAKLNPENEPGRFFLNADFEGRIAVTRARGLRDRPGSPPVVLESTETMAQIAELFSKLGERPALSPFTRCLECNEPLTEEDLSRVRGEVPPSVEKHFNRYRRCPACKRIYWEGSHYEAMAREVGEIERLLEG
jgi:uncharacterized protein with PIN domain